MAVNNRNYDWEDISIDLPYGPVIGVESIEYSDSKEKEMVYGRGSMPIGRGKGNYAAQGKITLLRKEYQKLLDYCKQTGVSFYRLRPFPITIRYADDGEAPVVDVIRGAEFNERSQSASQNDKTITKELDFIAEKIVEDGVEPA